ncbi:hypothetical protein FRB90_001304 [Tulasnella sp. 427]|nr:hypothetical protein FRB90_001304 [Tulasnella sp. 427]
MTISQFLADPEYWRLVAERSQSQVYTTMAAWAWLLYDWVTTLDDEVSYVWVSLTMVAIEDIIHLHEILRDLLVNNRSCERYEDVVSRGIGTMVSLYLVEIAMQVRVHALYGGSKWVLYVNSAIFAVEVAVLSTMLGWERTHNVNIIPAPGGLMGCWNTQHPKLITICWFIALSFEVYLFALVAHKAYVRWKDEGRLIGVFSIMFRDAVMWFGVIAALLAWNAFAFATGKDGSIFLGLPFLHAASSIAGSKLVVDIRKAWQEGQQNSMIFVAKRPAPSRPPPPSQSKPPRPSTPNMFGKKFKKKHTFTIHKIDSDWDITNAGGDRPDSSSELIAMEELRALPVSRSLSGRLVNALAASPKRHADVVETPSSDQQDWRGASRPYRELRAPPPRGATSTRGAGLGSTDHLRNPQQHLPVHPYAVAGDPGAYAV